MEMEEGGLLAGCWIAAVKNGRVCLTGSRLATDLPAGQFSASCNQSSTSFFTMIPLSSKCFLSAGTFPPSYPRSLPSYKIITTKDASPGKLNMRLEALTQQLAWDYRFGF
jgi:hypothetical protein